MKNETNESNHELHPWFQLDSLDWFQRTYHRSSLVHRIRCTAERNHWTEEHLLLVLLECLAQENETLKERLSAMIGRYGLPTDPIVWERS